MSDSANLQDKTLTDKDEKVRKSVRSKRPPQSFSLLVESGEGNKPDVVIRKGRKRKLKGKSAANAPDRPCDILPNGEPFRCDFCKSPYVITRSSKQALKNKRSRHTPAPRNKIDPYTGKILVLCNACSITFDRPRKPRKIVSMPSIEEKEKHLKEAKEFAKTLAMKLNKPEAERLFCPVVRIKPCGCLQNYILADGDTEESEKRVGELTEMLQEARRLSSLKCYNIQNQKPPQTTQEDKSNKQKWSSKSGAGIGMGNGQKKSKAFEEFVFNKRQYLKQELKLCERAAQKVLVYSNNFLHKKLVTEQRSCRAKPVKGLARLGLLQSWEDISAQNCCVDNCVMMAITHRTLLQEWRDRARKGQLEARRVIAEMLTPSAGARSNCYTFITLVTGSSRSTIVQVSHQMKQTGGDREPPVHGMKRYWRESGKRRDAEPQNCSSKTARCSVKSSAVVSTTTTVTIATSTPSKPAPVTSLSSSVIIPVSINQMVPPNNSMTLQRQQLYGIQKQIFEQQVQQQQQQHLLQQQLLQHTLIQQIGPSDAGSQNLTVLQQMIDQLNVQIQNTQQQLQQSLQNMNMIGALNNQSQTGPYPVTLQTFNQSQATGFSTQTGSNSSLATGQQFQTVTSESQCPQGINGQSIIQNNGASFGIYQNIHVLNQVQNNLTGNVQSLPGLHIQNQNEQIVTHQPNYVDGAYQNTSAVVNGCQETNGVTRPSLLSKDNNQVSIPPVVVQEIRPMICHQQNSSIRDVNQNIERHPFTVNHLAVQPNTEQTGLMVYDLNYQPVNQMTQSAQHTAEQTAPRQNIYTLVETQQVDQTLNSSIENINQNSIRSGHQVPNPDNNNSQTNITVAPASNDLHGSIRNDFTIKYATTELLNHGAVVSPESQTKQSEIQPILAIPISCNGQTGYIVTRDDRPGTAPQQNVDNARTIVLNSERMDCLLNNSPSSEDNAPNNESNFQQSVQGTISHRTTDKQASESDKTLETPKSVSNPSTAVSTIQASTLTYTRLEPSRQSAFYTPIASSKGTSKPNYRIETTATNRSSITQSKEAELVENVSISSETSKAGTYISSTRGKANIPSQLRFPNISPSTLTSSKMRLVSGTSRSRGSTILTQSCHTTTTSRLAPKTTARRAIFSKSDQVKHIEKGKNVAVPLETFTNKVSTLQKKDQESVSRSLLLLPVPGTTEVNNCLTSTGLSSENNSSALPTTQNSAIAVSGVANTSFSQTKQTVLQNKLPSIQSLSASHEQVSHNMLQNNSANSATRALQAASVLTSHHHNLNPVEVSKEKQVVQMPGGSAAYTFQLPLGFSSHTLQLPTGQMVASSQTGNSEIAVDFVQQPLQFLSIPAIQSNTSTLQTASFNPEQSQFSPIGSVARSQSYTSCSNHTVTVNNATMKMPNNQSSKLNTPAAKTQRTVQNKAQSVEAAPVNCTSQLLPMQSSSGTQIFQLPGGITPQTVQVPTSALQLPSGAAFVRLGTPTSKSASNIPVVMTLGKLYLEQPKPNDTRLTKKVPHSDSSPVIPNNE